MKAKTASWYFARRWSKFWAADCFKRPRLGEAGLSGADSLTAVPFDRYFFNTITVTFAGMAGMLFSCSLVAYGFSRFRAPGMNILFLLLLSTIMLPRQVTLIPIYILFQNLGWVNTLLPLIVPQFFANAYDVFLLRQFFMTIPLELDDAAKLDGASPLQISPPIIITMMPCSCVGIFFNHLSMKQLPAAVPIFGQAQPRFKFSDGIKRINLNKCIQHPATILHCIAPL
jgi:ABC-type glycerol-3-phosphate transport system permease component